MNGVQRRVVPRVVGQRVVALMVAAAIAVVATGCSEPAPDTESAPNQTNATTETCSADLLACARHSTIAGLVPKRGTKATGEPITLGMINQENTAAGSFPELSQAVQAGVDFVNEELGGVDGHPLAIDVCNTEFSTEGSTKCGQKFVDEGVPAVLGGIDVFGTAIETLEDNGIPYIGGIPVSTQSVEASNSFQWSGGTWGATVAFADYILRKLHAERAAIVYGEFASITQSAEYGERVLERAHIDTQLVPYPILATDISSALNAAATSDPDAIVILAADTGCKPAFEGIEALDTDATVFYVGACAAPTIIADVDVKASDGAIFNVEGPISQTHPDPDFTLYASVVEKYGKGLDPIGAGTVSYRAFMNLYTILRELGADHVSSASITDALSSKVEEPSYMGHDYTCDHEQFEGLPAMCSPQQILARMKDRELSQVGSWIDVGKVYDG